MYYIDSENVYNKELDSLLSDKGIFLYEDLGTRNWAQTKENSLQLLDKLKMLRIPVLGGDVIECIKGRMKYNYDSWHCDKENVPEGENYLHYSIDKTKHYILNYKIKKKKKIFFVLILKVDRNNPNL